MNERAHHGGRTGAKQVESGVEEGPQRRRGGGLNHRHLLALLRTEIQARPATESPLRVLDAGCGRGEFLEYLTDTLPEILGDRPFELYGYDVSDHGVQLDGSFLSAAVSDLSAHRPHIPWTERVFSIGETERWPFPDNHFDVVFSNQVLEHVRNAPFFFSELERVLCPGGFSAHLFPLTNSVIEWHCRLPFVHWPRTHDVRKSMVRLMTLLRLGPFWRLPPHERRLSDFCEQMADYILHFTSYRTGRELVNTATRCRLRSSFRYTREYYLARLRRTLRLRAKDHYRIDRSAWGDHVSAALLKYLASVTLFVEKQQSYRGLGLDA